MGELIGVDEAGRGAWAGPLIAAAVHIAADWDPRGVMDSKRLSARQREHWLPYILKTAKSVGVGWAAPTVIDNCGLTRATALAMGRAAAEADVAAGENVPIIIDGCIDYLSLPGSRTLIRADRSIPAVAAASIIAKCYRDRYMRSIEHLYAGYGFGKHVGYGTRFHLHRLRVQGATAMHRDSFRPIRIIKSQL